MLLMIMVLSETYDFPGSLHPRKMLILGLDVILVWYPGAIILLYPIVHFLLILELLVTAVFSFHVTNV